MRIEKDTNYINSNYDYKIYQTVEGGEGFEELTIEITLSEYRELVRQNAVSKFEYEKIQSENWKLNKEIDELKETILKLTGQTTQEDEEN